MTEQEIEHLWSGLISVTVSVLLIVGIKRVGKIPYGQVGPELNLLTYGFLWDTAVRAMSKENFWPHIWGGLANFRVHVLVTIAIFNAVLMVWNFELAFKLDSNPLSMSPRRRIWLKLLVYFIGLISLMIFLTTKTFWE